MPKTLLKALSLFIIGLFSSSAIASDCASNLLLYQIPGDSTDGDTHPNVAGIGDVNSDGKPDFILGFPFAERNGIYNAGSVYVYSGVDGSLIYRKDGTGFLENFGWSVAGAGDVNADGTPDFIVGSNIRYPYYDGFGSGFIYSGVDGSLLFKIDGSSVGDVLGYSVSGAGDVNGDGRADLILGAPSTDPGGIENAGSAIVFSGMDGSLLYQKNGTDTGGQFGVSVAGVGDINVDGKADFIIGANRNNPGGLYHAGSVYIYSGADGAILFEKHGTVGQGLGWSVAGAGDINRDGTEDFIIGGLQSASVYSGSNGTELFPNNGEPFASGYGQSVAGAGDVNADGTLDFILGGLHMNSASVYSGADGSLLSRIKGGADYDLGRSVDGIGDINGDGKSEVIVATAPNYFGGPGIAYVFSIKPAAKLGDLNSDGLLTPGDLVMELNAVFLGIPLSVPFCAADVYCDGILTAVDVVFLLDAIFLGVSSFGLCIP